MSLLTISRRLGNLIGFLVCTGLMGCALYFQYGLNLDPCPLCILQRVAVITVGVLFLIAALHNPGRTGARWYAALLVIATVAGALVSSRHLWIQAQPPGSVAACGASLDYLLDIMPVTEVITKVLTGSGECARVDWSLFGLSMPGWVLIALIGLGGWAAWVNLRK
jgi:protein dithiol:quinone oxidoreductase